MAERTLPKLREEVYTVADPDAIPNQWALFVDSDGLRCELYRDGEFLDLKRAELGDYSGGVAEGGATLIETDTFGEVDGAVGDGSFAWATASGVYVWDVEGEVVHSYALAEGIQATTPLYDEQYLFWLECPTVAVEAGEDNYESDVRLMRSAADLTSVTELAAWTFTTGAGAGGAPPVGIRAVRLTAARVHFVFVKIDDGDGEVHAWRIDRDGTDLVETTSTWEAAHGLNLSIHNTRGVCQHDGEAVYAIEPINSPPSEVLVWRQGDVTAAPSEEWPAVVDDPNEWALSGIRSISLFADKAQLYGVDSDVKLLRVPYLAPIDTVPEVSVDVETDGSELPTAMFYRGDLV